MKIIRIIIFVICFYFVVPFDLYITSHFRLYYYGTDVNIERIVFDLNPQPIPMNITVNVTQNISVILNGTNETVT
jgi:hypothetical protein